MSDQDWLIGRREERLMQHARRLFKRAKQPIDGRGFGFIAKLETDIFHMLERMVVGALQNGSPEERSAACELIDELRDEARSNED